MKPYKVYRYELKFLIDHDQRDHLLELAGPALLADPAGESGAYRVTSRYFDSPALASYWEKLDGVNRRQKYRLRYYGLEVTSPFFEIKHRHNRIIFKERIPLEPEGAIALLSGEEALVNLETYALARNPEEEDLKERLLYFQRHLSLKPQAIISYWRLAYLGQEDPGVRVTFDHRCMAYKSFDLQAINQEKGAPLECAKPIVMELKFNQAIPRWLAEAANQIRPNAVRFSKYAQGMDALGQ